MRDPDLISGSNGDNGALQYLLDELKKVGLEPNLKKFQAYATPSAAAAVPSWLKRPFYTSYPLWRADVETANVESDVAEAAASAARDGDKAEAVAAAKTAAEVAAKVLDSLSP